MQVVGESIKIAKNYVQLTPVVDNFGVPKVQLRYFKVGAHGRPNFKARAQDIYMLPEHWELLKKELRKRKNENHT